MEARAFAGFNEGIRERGHQYVHCTLGFKTCGPTNYLGFQGAVGRVGWTEIAENPEKFIDPSRLPDGLLHKIGDPSSLHMDVVVSFVDYFLCCHSGKVPHEKIFQLQLIFAGSHPIHPSDSQETSREQIEHGGKVGWMLRFDRTVTKCHHPKGMNYSPGAHDYARYVSAGFESPLAACVAPQSWLELPIAGPGVPDKIIIDREYEKYTSLASLLPENSKNRIIKILDATNKHQHHIPASVGLLHGRALLSELSFWNL